MKIQTLICSVLICLSSLNGAYAQSKSDASVPHLQKQGTATQLIVDGKPFIMLAGELHNSSSSSMEYMKPIWPRLVKMNLNTVLAAVTWDLIEPEEGKFDFSSVDGLIEDARKNNFRLVFLWFASWKNGISCYVPLWVKTDYKRFPHAQDQKGKNLDILSTIGDASSDADARAYAALMRHIREVDGKQHTVIMIQVENEVGVLRESRDRSPAANKAFAGQVPKELMDYLVQHKDVLIPEFREVWQANGSKTSGTWEEVFGPGKPENIEIPVRTTTPPMSKEEHDIAWRKLYWPVDEIFMAWHYAKYVNKIAAAGKAEYNIPMYANAWLQQRDHAWPGTYPCGGPLPQVIDVWHAGAPSIDILAPDLYVAEFAELCARFTRAGNPLLIPETRGGAQGAAKVLHAVGQYNAIGFSPFGIDGSLFRPESVSPENDPLSQCYAALAQLMPLITEHQGKGTMAGVSQGVADDGALAENQTQLKLGDYTLNITFSSPSPRQQQQQVPPGRPGDNLSPGGAIVISTGPDQYTIFSTSVGNITFTPNTPGLPYAGLASVDEGAYVDGSWIQGRRLNGDETGHGEHLRPAPFRVYRVKLYRHP